MFADLEKKPGVEQRFEIATRRLTSGAATGGSRANSYALLKAYVGDSGQRGLSDAGNFTQQVDSRHQPHHHFLRCPDLEDSCNVHSHLGLPVQAKRGDRT